MLSNLATLRKHLEMVFVEHILLCFNRRCRGSSFTAAQGCGQRWETGPLPAFRNREKKIPHLCSSRGRILLGNALELPLPSSAGPFWPVFAGEVGGFQHGAAGQGWGHCLVFSLGIKALPSESPLAAALGRNAYGPTRDQQPRALRKSQLKSAPCARPYSLWTL